MLSESRAYLNLAISRFILSGSQLELDESDEMASKL